MEDILASIKKVIAEEKELRQSIAVDSRQDQDEAQEAKGEEEVLELNEPVSAPADADLGPPLLDQTAADQSRSALEQLSTAAAAAPPQPQINPLEEMLRDMLRPILKQWLDEHLPRIVEDHVKREITRITGRPL